MIPTDEQALNLWLDEHPGDLVARAVLADWLEENGRDDEAEGQRWLIAEGKWPTYRQLSPKGFSIFHRERPWEWWSKDEHRIWLPAHARMPYGMLTLDNDDCRYVTRSEAEADAIAYARRNGLLGKPLSRTAERR